jgi:site-specific DNA recombinase
MSTLPMDGYIRVSQVAGRSGDRFQSPDTQRDAIKAWAKAQGVRIGSWHEDLDRSGGTMDRPAMNAALRRVRAGKSGGVVVARFDRFSRTVLGGLKVIEELAELDARVVSVAEGLDPATPHGKAMLSIVLAMAQWQRDLANEALGSAQRRAASAGRFPGRPSYGYRRDDDGLTFVDETAATIVRRIFTERAAGNGWRAIADRLTRDGIPTPHNGRTRWAPTTVADIIRSEATLGVFVGPRGLRVEDAWPGIIDRGLWQRANDIRGVRDDARKYKDRLFAGIVRCAGCRLVMTRQINPHGFVSYGCPPPLQPRVGHP